MDKLYDVIIIGAGVVGSAIARELSRYKLEIAVLEKNLDVCFETSSRNTGVCHGGFAYDPGSLKARLCVEGNKMMGQLSEELGFSFKRCGKVLVGNTDEEYEQLLRVMAQGGYCQMRISQMLEEEKGLKETELVYMRKDGHPFFGKVREEEGWDPAAGVAAGNASSAESASAAGCPSGAGSSVTGKEVAK